MQHKQAAINKKIVELLAPYGVAPDACPLVYFQSPTVFDVMTFGSDLVWRELVGYDIRQVCGSYFADADNCTRTSVVLHAERAENDVLFVELELYYTTWNGQHALGNYGVTVSTDKDGY